MTIMTKERAKRSNIWKINPVNLSGVVKASTSISEILTYFKFKKYGRNNYILKKKLNKEGIDYSHIKQGRNSNKENMRGGRKKKDINEFLIEDATCDRRALKKRLLAEGLLVNRCYKCGQEPVWNGLKLVLQLEHKNGKSKDYRLQNLEILCPNCHTQTTTYAGRNKIYL